MGGTVCGPTDKTDYCVLSRNFHMLSMILTVIFIIDFVLGGNLINWLMKRWRNNFKK